MSAMFGGGVSDGPGWLSRLSTAGKALLDLLYPPRCVGCGRVGSLFCDACQAQIELIRPPVCRRCGRPLATGGLCPTCQRVPSALDGITSIAIFAHPLRAAIHSLKYGNGIALAAPLGAFMADAWREAGLSADLIVPVPLHPSRVAERGYNQSALLADVLGPAVGVPVAEHVLVRQKATLPQVTLGRSERRQNVRGAFTCRGDVAGQRIVLVDDVCTTGATLEACAAALRSGGVAAVWGFTLARPRWTGPPIEVQGT